MTISQEEPHTMVSDALTLDANAIRSAAAALFAAERDRTQISLLTDAHPTMRMEDAYAIQAEWVRAKREAGDGIVGWKIGLTSRAMQSALSIDIPDSGVLLQSMVFENGDIIPADRFIQPRIEAEIGFVMKEAIVGYSPSSADILAATDYIVPAIEILDTRIIRKDPVSGRMRTVFDTIADNAANAGIVLGKPVHDFDRLDLRWLGAIVSRNGEVEETGLGGGVLNDPLLAISWLADRLGTCGDRIEAAQIVLSGSFIRPVEAPSGSHIVADFGMLGRVECSFA
ncbi:2-oxo-hepta-3-ene-1,7-dioic acid hydratase [Sphingobium sp. H39-3-25]|uniref:2-oxo-hepta-3-ene-1,7-dioic acid hydratase n=1 Tax=Sphingobium arseniciresistens TaxID=3030834 RepID=UPI0023B99E10|nr:2-oxo-hepta-3-ene-1,7-dioic acid hydratase [Sphingobium arseniciresistens]